MLKVKTFLNKCRKKIAAVAVASVSALAMAVGISAAESGTSGLSGASDQIINQFTGAATDILPIIIGVLGAGLTIFVVFVGIKLAKKMFSTVSK